MSARDAIPAAPLEEEAAAVVVLVRELRVDVLVGVHAHERTAPQTLAMDLELELGSVPASRSDRLEETVDYAAVVADVREQLAATRYFLLEALAEFTARRLLARFGARRVVVQVMKLGILEGVGRVGVRVERGAAPAAAPRLRALVSPPA